MNTKPSQTHFQPTRERMYTRQLGKIVVESISYAASKYPDLSHATPEKFAIPPRSGDEILCSDDTRPDRCTYKVP